MSGFCLQAEPASGVVAPRGIETVRKVDPQGKLEVRRLCDGCATAGDFDGSAWRSCVEALLQLLNFTVVATVGDICADRLQQRYCYLALALLQLVITSLAQWDIDVSTMLVSTDEARSDPCHWTLGAS